MELNIDVDMESKQDDNDNNPNDDNEGGKKEKENKKVLDETNPLAAKFFVFQRIQDMCEKCEKSQDILLDMATISHVSENNILDIIKELKEIFESNIVIYKSTCMLFRNPREKDSYYKWWYGLSSISERMKSSKFIHISWQEINSSIHLKRNSISEKKWNFLFEKLKEEYPIINIVLQKMGRTIRPSFESNEWDSFFIETKKRGFTVENYTHHQSAFL